jgi:pimeloyl-ACP methyl ester carboxylesterase
VLARAAAAPGDDMIKKAALFLLAVPALFYAGLCAMLYLEQRAMIYFPTPATVTSLAEAMHLTSQSEDLKIWHHPGVTGRAILYFGGNAENVAANIGNFRTVFPDDSLYLMNYRGFGGSTGTPSEQAFYADALALFDYVSQTHGEIAVIGRSLGSGVAAHLAAHRDVSQLVLVTPFDSLENVVKERYFAFPIAMLLRDKYDTLSAVRDIESNVLAILAEHDEVVSYQRSLSLLEAFPADQVRTIVVSGAGHDSIGLSPAYLTSLWEFLGHREAPVSQLARGN